MGLVALVSFTSSLAIRWRPVAFRQGAYSRLEAEVGVQAVMGSKHDRSPGARESYGSLNGHGP